MTFSRRRALIPACAAVATLTLAACGGGHHHAPAVTSTSPTPTPTPTPTVTKPAAFTGNPLTGAAKASNNPVVAVKIDDTAAGRPQVNIDKADIVYIEEAEGGLTRLLAVFDTTLPTVEAVRSTRASDPELVQEYGPIAYTASGGGGDTLQILQRSSLKPSINDLGGPGFARDGSRGAPYNLTANLAAIGQAVHGPKAKDIGLTWAAHATNPGATKATELNTVVGSTGVQFVWANNLGRYARYIDGVAQTAADGKPIATPNVIVQFCTVTPYAGDVDVEGNVSQYTHTVGKGKAVIFRNGYRFNGTWTRAHTSSGTVYTDAKGKKIPLAPGGVWIVLVATNAPLSSH